MFFRLFFKEGQGSRDGEACFEEGAPFAGKDGECLVSGEWFPFQEAASFFSDASFVREIIEKPRRRSAFAASPPELALMVPSSIAPSVLKTL